MRDEHDDLLDEQDRLVADLRRDAEQGKLPTELELLLHEVDAADPVVSIATGVFASRHGLTVDEAFLVLRLRFPDPAERHDYCVRLLDELGQARGRP